ncbi:MAG: hypothetical protein J6M38_08045, partial [Lentisphaeria bacterium]|nr:hypothetical protein [Lentisphaeria bacterium]
MYVSGGTFEIDFDKIGENASLRALGMNGMSLHENYHVEAYNGMVDMWYDDVSLKDHLDFLKNFPNLEELYLDGSGWSGYSYGLEVAGDISSIFNHPGLEELYVSGGTFEIDFDKIGENASLRALG